MLIFSGIFIHAVKNDDELAAVLAHEIAHVLANHAIEDRSIRTVARIVSLPFLPFAFLAQFVAEAIVLALPIAGVALVESRLSRKREEEADYIGLILMVDAGFDPSAAVSVRKKFKEMEDQMLLADPRLKQIPQWISTHPHVSRVYSWSAHRL